MKCIFILCEEVKEEKLPDFHDSRLKDENSQNACD